MAASATPGGRTRTVSNTVAAAVAAAANTPALSWLYPTAGDGIGARGACYTPRQVRALRALCADEEGCSNMQRERISTASAPGAIGPYSQAIVCGDLVFASGQVALDPATGQLIEGDIEAQTRRALENLG